VEYGPLSPNHLISSIEKGPFQFLRWDIVWLLGVHWSIPASSALFIFFYACASRIYCGNIVRMRVVQPSPDWQRTNFFACIQLLSVKAHSFQFGALNSRKRCAMYDQGGLRYLLGVHPWCRHFFPFAAVFLESLGSLHKPFLAILPFPLEFRESFAACISEIPCCIWWLVLIISNQDCSFVISCSLAALFQTTRIHTSHIASGRGGILLCW